MFTNSYKKLKGTFYFVARQPMEGYRSATVREGKEKPFIPMCSFSLLLTGNPNQQTLDQVPLEYFQLPLLIIVIIVRAGRSNESSQIDKIDR